MELKHGKRLCKENSQILLIVPYGIETLGSFICSL